MTGSGPPGRLTTPFGRRGAVNQQVEPPGEVRAVHRLEQAFRIGFGLLADPMAPDADDPDQEQEQVDRGRDTDDLAVAAHVEGEPRSAPSSAISSTSAASFAASKLRRNPYSSVLLMQPGNRAVSSRTLVISALTATV